MLAPLAVAVAAVALALVVLAVLAIHLCGNLRLRERQARELEDRLAAQAQKLERLEAQKNQLSGFLGVLPALAHELRYAASERRITSTLVDTLVSTLEPRQAVVLMRRRGRTATGEPSTRYAVAATTPNAATAMLGRELQLVADGHDPSTFDGEALRRAGLDLPAPLLTAPLILETEVVGLVALSPSNADGDVPLILQGVADVGALALHDAATRQRIRSTADVDELTRIFNRRYISRALAEEQQKAEQGQHPLSVLLFDIDHFKRYNDANGHLEGDILLRLLAQLVHDNVRATDVVGRFGGEEFLVLLPRTTMAEALVVADKLRALIANTAFPARESQPTGRITVSGGVAEFPTTATGTTTLLRAADEALYAAKDTGRNRIIGARPHLDEERQRDAPLEEEWGDE